MDELKQQLEKYKKKLEENEKYKKKLEMKMERKR